MLRLLSTLSICDQPLPERRRMKIPLRIPMISGTLSSTPPLKRNGKRGIRAARSSYLRKTPEVKPFSEATIWSRPFVRRLRMTAATTCSAITLVEAAPRQGWHQVSVTISKKGAHARYRNGFFLPKDTSTTSARQDVHLALTSPLDLVGVTVSITWSSTSDGKSVGKTRVKFDLVMQPTSLPWMKPIGITWLSISLQWQETRLEKWSQNSLSVST